jgi:hypothetical protein
MLELRQSINVASIFCLADDKLYSLLKDNSAINVFDSISGQLESTINASGQLPHDVKGIAVTGTKLVVYSSQGIFVCFDTEKASPICTVSSKIKSSKVVTHICASRAKDDMFFIVRADAPTLTALYVSSSSATLVTSIRLPDIMMDKNKQEIVNIFCHPSKPYLFVCHKKGAVQVWNYTAVRKHVMSKTSSEDDSEQDNGVGGGGGDSDNDDDQDNPDDERIKSTSSSSKVEKDLLPIALLTPPDIDVGGNIQHAVLSPSGHLCAVSWGHAVSVYSTSVHPSTTNSTTTTNTNTNTNSKWKVHPLGSFSPSDSDSGSVTSVLQSLGPVAFHPSEPLLFQVMH